MSNITKKISIVGVPDSTRDIGAEAQNIDVSYDSSDNIILDINAPGVVVDHTKTVAKALQDTAKKEHSSNTAEYGVASTVKYGHVKIGTGFDSADGVISVKYGTTSNSACSGDDARLTNHRSNPNPVIFENGETEVSYDGSISKTVNYETVGAAPENHAHSTNKFGMATKSNYGHVKLGEGLENKEDLLSLSIATEDTFGGVKIDNKSVLIDEDGVLSCDIGSTIKIHTDEPSLYGKEITIRKSGEIETITTVFDSSGNATIKNYNKTESIVFTCSNSSGIQATNTLYIPYFGNYSVTLRFWTARVTIQTITPEFFNLDITVYKYNSSGGRVEVGSTRFNDEGIAEYIVHEMGLYDFTCSPDAGYVFMSQVQVEIEQNYTININTWISSVNITTPSPEFYNKQIIVTWSDGSSTYQRFAQFDDRGKAIFRAYETSDYTFSVIYDEKTYSSYLLISGAPITYNIEIKKFNTYVHITTDEPDFIGETGYVTLFRDDASEKIVGDFTFDSSGSVDYLITKSGTYKFTIGE